MKKIISALFIFIIVMITSRAYCVTIINFTDGGNAFADLSSKNLNLIKFPSSGVKVYTSSKVLDIKIEEGNVFVKFLEEISLPPQEVFFILSTGEVFSMILVPKEIPSQTIVMRLPQEDMAGALEWETSHNYISGLKNLVKAMYEGRPPMGFTIKEANREVPVWSEVRMTLKQIYHGATLVGEIYEVLNIAKEPIRFSEKEFYESGILAVSLEKHELRPGEKTELYLVKKSKTQRDLERVIQKSNPLDILGGK